jgi:dTDP-4-dehydrorhamnose reductase
MNILVTGANGQLGSELKKIHHIFPDYLFDFTDIDELDITDARSVQTFFEQKKYHFCINTAAYTAVDKAENEQDKAYLINTEAVKHLAQQCAEHHTVLIHISTDYVFSGKSYSPYHEEDNTNPISIYGKTKLEGEQIALQTNPQSIVIRTSWLYSTFGHNFVKTMLRLAENKSSISVVADQVGSPTYAEDLAQVIVQIMNFVLTHKNNSLFGIYHYSNEGVASWYDFAHAIFQLKSLSINILPIKTVQYPTPAQRPSYSILDKNKIKSTFGIKIPHWRDSLARCLEKLGR